MREITPFTMFTVPRSFDGEIGTIQSAAIGSWLMLKPRPEVLFISDDEGVAEVARKLGCRHVPGVQCNEYGTPSVGDVFRKAQKLAMHDWLCYSNSDIVFTQSLSGAAERARKDFQQFLMIGQRIDFYRPKLIDFSVVDWGIHLVQQAQKRGTLHGPAGLDWFFFKKGMYPCVPDFGLGRRGWDNWLAWYILREGLPVIDATKVVHAVHIGKTTNKPMTPEIRQNRELASHAGRWGRANFATWEMRPEYDFPGELFV